MSKAKKIKQRLRKLDTTNPNSVLSVVRLPTANKFNSRHHGLAAIKKSYKRGLWICIVIVTCVLLLFSIIIINFCAKQHKQPPFAKAAENISLKKQTFPCSDSYSKEVKKFRECLPNKCGRFVTDKLVNKGDAEALLEMAKNIISLAGSNGGASILDIHGGALSYGDKFINMYQIPQAVEQMKSSYLTVYNMVKNNIKLSIAKQFGISPSHLYLTYPTFFSQINNNEAKTLHDEYWHEHVDKDTYPSFHYTSLLYLNTFNEDYKGGRFVFVDGDDKQENRTRVYIEPKMGRVSVFTSGVENRHHVEKVTEGVRYAVTISFTCDRSHAIGDPKLETT